MAKEIEKEPLFRQAEGFIFSKSLGGIAIHLNQSLESFLNEEDPSWKIREWYLSSFKKMKDFMTEMNGSTSFIAIADNI